ncbi:MAG TPA: tetraacyldisaccharide 4'-kinase [Thiothrix sp.]|nr:tetraacyldisaccharide 4'-kinase [Thiothrix sp.]
MTHTDNSTPVSITDESAKPWLHRLFEKTWYAPPHWRYRGLMYALLPLVPVFCVLGRYRRWQQVRSRPAKPSVPVIVVGNLTVGGTGKTPLVIYLAKLLKTAGYRPAIISRGYGGRAKTWPQNVTAASHPDLVGDEPVLMASRSHVPVVVGADRNTDIQYLLNYHKCDVILSDDGLQHYRMARQMEIIVMDGQRGFGNGWCLPAGPLREPIKRWLHSDFRLINMDAHTPLSSDARRYQQTSQSDNTHTDKHTYQMQLVGQQLISLNHHAPKALSDFAGQTVHAVSGIGHPERFFKQLRAQGLQLIPHSFSDHHRFNKAELCFNEDYPIIMTEKDAVKCRGFSLDNAWYLPVEAQLSEPFDQAFLAAFEQCKREYNRSPL